jgi:uncharacterized cupredoxin-like copper-binding protein
LLALVVVLAGTLAAACTNSSTQTVGHRTGDPGSMMARGFAGPMMGSMPHRYDMSQLTCSAPSSLPGTTVYVMVADLGMTRIRSGVAPIGIRMMLRALPARVPTGQVSFVVGNMGWRTHEMVILPLAPGQAEGQRVPGADGRVSETGILGEASASCSAGAGDGIKPGTVGWVTLNLSPGRYELICNLRNHYANGMHQAFIVT